MTEGSIPASSKVYSLSGNEKTLESRTSYRIVENPEYSRDNTSLLQPSGNRGSVVRNIPNTRLESRIIP